MFFWVPVPGPERGGAVVRALHRCPRHVVDVGHATRSDDVPDSAVFALSVCLCVSFCVFLDVEARVKAKVTEELAETRDGDGVLEAIPAFSLSREEVRFTSALFRATEILDLGDDEAEDDLLEHELGSVVKVSDV